MPTPSPWSLFLLVLSAAVLGGTSPGARAADAPASPELVPAAFGIWTDPAGSSWSVEAGGNIGRIGSAMVNSGLALLVDEEKFESFRPMMTPDGKELVLQGLPLAAFPGLEAQRRVRLLDHPGGLLYTELFHNGSSAAVTFSVGLSTNFSGNFKTFLSERGRPEPLLMGDFETGILVLPGASQSSRAFLFTLAGASGGIRPSISSQNRYGLVFRYRLDLAPGESAVIVHHVAQIAIPQDLDRRTLLGVASPFALDALRPRFDPDWRSLVVNATEPPLSSPRGSMEAGGAAALGRGEETLDVLALGESTRLTGKAEGEGVVLKSNFGTAQFPLDRIAAVTGSRRAGEEGPRLYLRDGQVLSGTLAGPGLAFLPTGGTRLPLEPENLDRLLLSGAGSGNPWPGEAILLETCDGDRIRLEPEPVALLNLLTPWGSLPIALGELAWLRPASSGVGHRVFLQNGTEIEGYIESPELAVSSAEFGSTRLPATRLKQVVTPRGWKLGAGELIPATGTVVRLPGSQTLQGRVVQSKVLLLAGGASLEIPLAEVRRLEREGTGRETHRLERWDGGVLAGTLALDFLAVEVAGNTWQIPVRDLAGIDFAPPELDGETLSKVEDLVGRLASPEWATREAATRELGAFGYLARPFLQRELAETTDPEVARRLERILSEPL